MLRLPNKRFSVAENNNNNKLKLQAALNGTEHPTQLDPRRLGPPAATAPATLVVPADAASGPDCSQSSLYSTTASLIQAEAVRVSLPQLQSNTWQAIKINDQSKLRVHFVIFTSAFVH